jgi:hypothetical protein
MQQPWRREFLPLPADSGSAMPDALTKPALCLLHFKAVLRPSTGNRADLLLEEIDGEGSEARTAIDCDICTLSAIAYFSPMSQPRDTTALTRFPDRYRRQIKLIPLPISKTSTPCSCQILHRRKMQSSSSQILHNRPFTNLLLRIDLLLW